MLVSPDFTLLMFFFSIFRVQTDVLILKPLNKIFWMTHPIPSSFSTDSRVWRTICTSVSLWASIRVSPAFALHRHSSPSFGSQQTCSYSNLLTAYSECLIQYLRPLHLSSWTQTKKCKVDQQRTLFDRHLYDGRDQAMALVDTSSIWKLQTLWH